MPAEDYGQFYWCIKVPKSISEDGEVYAYADRLVVEDGVLVLLGKKGGPVIAFARNKWFVFYAASCLDGHAVAAEHWKGEISEEK